MFVVLIYPENNVKYKVKTSQEIKIPRALLSMHY